MIKPVPLGDPEGGGQKNALPPAPEKYIQYTIGASQKAPHTKHYVRAWEPKGAAYKVLCASMEAKRRRIQSTMCEHGSQQAYGAFCASDALGSM